MKLYEILAEIDNFDFQVDEETGELLNRDELDYLNIQLDEKIENLALLIKNLDSFEKSLKEEENQLKQRRDSVYKRKERCKAYLSDILDGRKFETPRCKISFRQTSSVEVSSDFVEWAKDHRKNLVRINLEPDKTAIKNAILNGDQDVMVGAWIKTKNSMIIK